MAIVLRGVEIQDKWQVALQAQRLDPGMREDAPLKTFDTLWEFHNTIPVRNSSNILGLKTLTSLDLK